MDSHSAFQNYNDDVQTRLNKMWTSLKAWMGIESNIETFFNADYIQYDNGWNGSFCYLCIPFDEEYKLYYGQSFSQDLLARDIIQPNELKCFIEIMYERWIKTKQRYSFTIEINDMLGKFSLPYRLSSGILESRAYKTTENIERILNTELFEEKIKYSEKMIMSNVMSDKKVALDSIVDAFQYYLSIQAAESTEKKYSNAARSVCSNQDSKVYAVIKNEIKDIMRFANEYFDIRHNEYLNNAKEKREALADKQFIEYLYNRVYALLYLLRLKVKSNTILTDGK